MIVFSVISRNIRLPFLTELEINMLDMKKVEKDTVCHFLVALDLCFKVRLKCETIDLKMIFFYSYANKTQYHKKGFAHSLIWKVRVFGPGRGEGVLPTMAYMGSQECATFFWLQVYQGEFTS